MWDFFNFLNFAKISTSLVFYLTLMIFLKIGLEKIPFPKQIYFKQALEALKAVLHVLIIVLSFIVGLGLFGVDIQGIITGLGLMSFAIGLIFKDVLNSLISGFFILIYKPFNVGDEITIEGIKGEGIKGTVLKMDIRYTTLESGRNLHLIPNSRVIDAPITLTKTE